MRAEQNLRDGSILSTCVKHDGPQEKAARARALDQPLTSHEPVLAGWASAAADSRRSSRTTAARASGLTPCSVSPTRTDSVSLSSPVCSSCEMSYRTAHAQRRRLRSWHLWGGRACARTVHRLFACAGSRSGRLGWSAHALWSVTNVRQGQLRAPFALLSLCVPFFPTSHIFPSFDRRPREPPRPRSRRCCGHWLVAVPAV